MLSKRKNSRIFQKQDAAAIAGAVLREHLVVTSPAVFTRALAEREYCVQYDESDSEFVHRLLAEEGVAAYFDHAAGSRWTLVDDTTLQKPSPDPDLRVLANAANLKPEALAVLRWRSGQRIEPVAVARRDYDFQRPLLPLEHASAPFDAPSPAEAALEVYEYQPDRLLRPKDDGGETARDLQAARAMVETAELWTNFAASAGTSLHVEGEDLGGDWLVVGAEVVFRSAPLAQEDRLDTHREVRLTAIPLSTPYRPPLRKRPLIFGTQSARIVGATPDGTVDVDEYGRVNLEFRWDRRELRARGEPGKENPTRRVRVAQAWAGAGYGFVTLPRIGDEVLVAYEDGNPDRPLVIGRVHNAVSRSPLQLRDEAYKSIAIWMSRSFGPNGPVDGCNFIYMDDAAGAELLALQAQRDMAVVVGRNSTKQVGGEDVTEVGGNQALTVSGSQTIRIGAGKSGVGAGAGSAASTAAGDQIVNVKGGYSLGAKNVSLDAKEEVRVDAGTDLTLNAAAYLIENSRDQYVEATNTFTVHAGEIALRGKVVTLTTEDGSSKIVLSPGRIEITSAGIVEVNGNPIQLNC